MNKLSGIREKLGEFYYKNVNGKARREKINIPKICDRCKKQFFTRSSYKKARFCSKDCQMLFMRPIWKSNILKQRALYIDMTGKPPKRYLSDQEILTIWEEYKSHLGTISLERIFKQYGYKKPPDSLRALVGIEAYNTAIKKHARRPMRIVAGRICEWKARRTLEGEGFYVIRSAGSKGIWDLIAFRANDNVCRLIQVKTGHKPTGKEWHTLLDFKAPEDWKKELWVYYKYVSEPEKSAIP